MNRSITLLLTILLGMVYGFATAQTGNLFFTAEDICSIQASSGTDWGQRILAHLKERVEERLHHPMEVPDREAGYFHDYFCPEHKVLLEFDWDKPTEHVCRYCGKNWHTDRLDWAWITLVHNRNQQFLTDCMYLYLATEEKKYASLIRGMLLDYSRKYSAYRIHDQKRDQPNNPAYYSARMFAQSLDESVWFSYVCRAYEVVRPLLSQMEIEKIEQGLFRKGADLLLDRPMSGNWQAWHNSGLAALGTALRDTTLISVAIDQPGRGVRDLLNTHVNRDGWWNENSPTYHFYPLRAMFLMADAVRWTGRELHGALKQMFLAPLYSLYPDLSFPSHNDGWYGESLSAQTALYEWAWARYGDSPFRQALGAIYAKNNSRNNPEALLTRDDIRPSDERFTMGSYLFAQTGYAMLCDSVRTIILKYGPHGGGHGHPDKLSISIHDGKQEILPDLGTCAYGIADYRDWYRKTLSHNTVTVDFCDQRAITGQLVYANDHSVGAFTDKAWPGVEMRRDLSLARGELWDVFECTSDSLHIYEYCLIFRDRPRIKGNFTETTMDESPAHRRISGAQKCTMKSGFVIGLPSASIHVKAGPGPFEVFTGAAPGIPPSNPGYAGIEPRAAKMSYPVIIRIRGCSVKISATWHFEHCNNLNKALS